MRTLQLLVIALGLVAAAACNRADADREARETVAELKTAAGVAGERLADGWLTTKVQAQFFADDDIKARYITVNARDGVVTLKGYVESEQVRQLALQIAKNTDGVRQVQDQLLVGRPANTFEVPDTVATTGSAAEPAATVTAGSIDDTRIVTTIQAKYFLDPAIKARDITIESRSGVVTLRGRVASDSERAQALILARMSEGVQRVEDGLMVDASLTPTLPTGTTGMLPTTPAPTVTPNAPAGSAPAAPAAAPAANTADASAETRITQELTADARLKAAQIEVSVKDGVVLMQGTVPNQAAKQRALTIARQADGVVQVVDRLVVARK